MKINNLNIWVAAYPFKKMETNERTTLDKNLDSTTVDHATEFCNSGTRI